MISFPAGFRRVKGGQAYLSRRYRRQRQAGQQLPQSRLLGRIAGCQQDRRGGGFIGCHHSPAAAPASLSASWM